MVTVLNFPKNKLVAGYRQPLLPVQGELNCSIDKRRHLVSWPAFTDSRGNESLLEAFTICILSSVQPRSFLCAKWIQRCRSFFWSQWNCSQKESWCMLFTYNGADSGPMVYVPSLASMPFWRVSTIPLLQMLWHKYSEAIFCVTFTAKQIY